MIKFIGKPALIIFTVFISSFNSLYANEPASVTGKVDSFYRFFPSRKVSAMSGGIEVREAGAEYCYEFKAYEKLPLKLSLENKYIGIENTTVLSLPSRLVSLAIDSEAALPLFGLKNYYLRIGVSPSFFGDSYNFSSSDFRLLSRLIFIYQPQDKWTYVMGAAFFPDNEFGVFPILGLIYKPNDRITFELTPKRPNISYLLNEKTTLFLEGGGVFNSEYEVDKDDLRNVVLRYKESHLGARVEYMVNKYIKTSLAAGSSFNRQLKYRDSLGKVNIKGGFYSEFRLYLKI